MSKKSKKRAAAKEAERLERMRRMAPPKKESKKVNKTKIFIVSAIATLLVGAIILGIVFSLMGTSPVNYLSDDLSKYLTISESDYKNYTVELVFDEVDDSTVERKIMKLLYDNRSEDAVDDGETKISIPISVGDLAYIYYRGYTVDEDGNQVDIANTSNFLDTDPGELEIGSGSFIPGFESGLIGAIPEEHQFEIFKSGNTAAGDVLYVTYKVTFPDGSSATKSSERIDLSKTDIDSKYGEGFKAYLEGGLTIGTKLESKTFNDPDGKGTIVYMDMKIDAATRCEDRAVTVDTRFPASYHEESLRGKEVKFDVYIVNTVVYETPEYDETFITETLGIKAEDLEKYEGADIVEKHRAKLLEEAKEENESNRKSIIEEAMWKQYNEKVKVKKLPEREVEDAYRERLYELQYLAQNYGYSDLGQFIIAYYGLGSNADWQAYIVAEVQNVIKEKLSGDPNALLKTFLAFS